MCIRDRVDDPAAGAEDVPALQRSIRPSVPHGLAPTKTVLGLNARGGLGRFADLAGDDRSVKIKSLEAAKIMKMNWLILGCIEADSCT